MKKFQKSGGGQGGKNSREDDSWERVKQTVRPYDKAPPSPLPPTLLPKPASKPASKKAEVSPVFRRQPGAGFDRATETKLKKGRLPIEGRIDLHGMTQEEAFRALQGFMAGAVSSGKRTVLVITGRGKGVLKRSLPLWLERQGMKEHILAITPAQPKDGGGGAFYVRLRRVRDD